ncbi:Glycoside hydrolase family 81 protein [Arachis hypogaea]|nr:Glycoside hydrolase family 81 protein [Arachis hypogaea]
MSHLYHLETSTRSSTINISGRIDPCDRLPTGCLDDVSAPPATPSTHHPSLALLHHRHRRHHYNCLTTFANHANPPPFLLPPQPPKASPNGALEIHAAQMWGHLKRDDEKFEEFTKENRLMEVLYSNNRESRVKWNTLAFHVLSLLPITEFLFSNVGFVKEQKRPWRVIARAASRSGGGVGGGCCGGGVVVVVVEGVVGRENLHWVKLWEVMEEEEEVEDSHELRRL